MEFDAEHKRNGWTFTTKSFSCLGVVPADISVNLKIFYLKISSNVDCSGN